ncbi:GFA family protein [Bradyrhizobium sp. LjRoot220]|uniref:GFA family protein n=1 Tax=Bradyrhizobium sp. LjRoot220 TaxID=3342284 RepID=UPI003F4F60EF
MIRASCHCGAVELEIDETPTEITECNCSICHRYGVLWAYYELRQVRISGPSTDIYMWDDRSIMFHRCSVCGCVSHWSPIDPQRNRMGVNARLMKPAILKQAKLRHLDGAVSERYLD